MDTVVARINLLALFHPHLLGRICRFPVSSTNFGSKMKIGEATNRDIQYSNREP
jgi:hypothetical protein